MLASSQQVERSKGQDLKSTPLLNNSEKFLQAIKRGRCQGVDEQPCGVGGRGSPVVNFTAEYGVKVLASYLFVPYSRDYQLKERTTMSRREVQAQIEHPRLYALYQQHWSIRLLGRLVEGKKARKARAPRQPRVQRSTYDGSPAPRTVVMHVHAGATVNLHNI